MKKMVAFDFDKTLYDHKALEIPASARRALRELRDKYGVVFNTRATASGDDGSAKWI